MFSMREFSTIQKVVANKILAIFRFILLLLQSKSAWCVYRLDAWKMCLHNEISKLNKILLNPFAHFEHGVFGCIFRQMNSYWIVNFHWISSVNLIFKLFFGVPLNYQFVLFFFVHSYCRKVYRKAISLRDGNSSGTNGNVLLRDDSTGPLAMNSHTISADEVKLMFKLYYWNFRYFLLQLFWVIRIEYEKLSNKWTIEIFIPLSLHSFSVWIALNGQMLFFVWPKNNVHSMCITFVRWKKNMHTKLHLALALAV